MGRWSSSTPSLSRVLPGGPIPRSRPEISRAGQRDRRSHCRRSSRRHLAGSIQRPARAPALSSLAREKATAYRAARGGSPRRYWASGMARPARISRSPRSTPSTVTVATGRPWVLVVVSLISAVLERRSFAARSWAALPHSQQLPRRSHSCLLSKASTPYLVFSVTVRSDAICCIVRDGVGVCPGSVLSVLPGLFPSAS